MWKPDLFDIHLIKQSWKDVENGHKWSWKILENAHKKVLESHGKPLSVFCTLPVKSYIIGWHRWSQLLTVMKRTAVVMMTIVMSPTLAKCVTSRWHLTLTLCDVHRGVMKFSIVPVWTSRSLPNLLSAASVWPVGSHCGCFFLFVEMYTVSQKSLSVFIIFTRCTLWEICKQRWYIINPCNLFCVTVSALPCNILITVLVLVVFFSLLKCRDDLSIRKWRQALQKLRQQVMERNAWREKPSSVLRKQA